MLVEELDAVAYITSRAPTPDALLAGPLSGDAPRLVSEESVAGYTEGRMTPPRPAPRRSSSSGPSASPPRASRRRDSSSISSRPSP